jgi:hypothetical protein
MCAEARDLAIVIVSDHEQCRRKEMRARETSIVLLPHPQASPVRLVLVVLLEVVGFASQNTHIVDKALHKL